MQVCVYEFWFDTHFPNLAPATQASAWWLEVVLFEAHN